MSELACIGATAKDNPVPNQSLPRQVGVPRVDLSSREMGAVSSNAKPPCSSPLQLTQFTTSFFAGVLSILRHALLPVTALRQLRTIYLGLIPLLIAEFRHSWCSLSWLRASRCSMLGQPPIAIRNTDHLPSYAQPQLTFSTSRRGLPILSTILS